jgi:uncharacterized membrane protein YjgN (DUF898 family)
MGRPDPLRASFTGRGGEFFSLVLKNFALTIITLGVYNFWARVNLRRYYFENCHIAGGRFGWHATGKERFFGFLKGSGLLAGIIALNALLIRLSPYLGFIFPMALLLLIPAVIVAMHRFRFSRTSFNQVRFRFTGRAGNLAAITLRGALLTLVTFGFYAPWLYAHLRQFLYRHTYIGDSVFDYDGKGGDILAIYFKGILLSVLTFGIYSSWFTAELTNYHASHTLFQNQRLKGTLDGADIFVTNFVGRLLSFLTVGIYAPWWIMKLQKIMTEGIGLTADPVMTLMEAHADTGASALADGLADATSLLDNIADFLT